VKGAAGELSVLIDPDRPVLRELKKCIPLRKLLLQKISGKNYPGKSLKKVAPEGLLPPPRKHLPGATTPGKLMRKIKQSGGQGALPGLPSLLGE
jgi:hypothetical protein